MAPVSPAEPTAPNAPPKPGHPIAFWFIFFGELAERASFYGMRAVLTLYLVHVFGYSREAASDLYHTYMAACYFTPLIGGWVADRYLGKYWTIVGFAVPYVIGQLLVGLSNEYLMFGALALLAMGSGVIKPNISTLMGLTYDQQRPGQDQLRSQAFSWFYVAINMGSFLASNICPWLRDTFGKMVPDPADPKRLVPSDPQAGYLAAFLFPAVLMVVALAIFAAGKRFYAVETVDRTPPTPAERASRWRVVGQVGGLFALVMFFWAVFDQKASTWVFFAEDYLDLHVLGYRIAPDRVMSLNPLFIILLVPVMNRVYAALAARGYDVSPTNKMMAGFLLTAACMALHAVAGYAATNPDGSITRVSILWQVLAYVTLTVAEILISVTGLELAFTAAPKSMKGFVTALWLVTVGLANLLINKPVTQMYPGKDTPTVSFLKWKLFELPAGAKFTSAADYFAALTVGMLVVTVVFFFVARRFKQSQAG